MLVSSSFQTHRARMSIAKQEAWSYAINDGALLPALACLYIVLTATAPHFLTLNNQLNILQQGSYVGIIAFAMTFVLVAGEIDISVGSNVGFSSAFLGVLAIDDKVPLLASVIIVLVVGAVIGAVIGAIRVALNVPSFITTLSFYLGLSGLANLITNANPVNIPSAAFAKIGGGSIFGIPYVGLIFIAVFLVATFVARRTIFGRSVYAIGGNADAARISGIAVRKVCVIVFVLTGVTAALVGVLQSSYLSSGDPSLGVGLEFNVIAAVIIGGTAISGGRGTMPGTLYGVVFVSVLNNGLVLLGVNSYAQSIVQGVVVLFAVLLSSLRSRITR
jgi:ribose/xylose/arabinose/galactoside ABC-type transport system permease subunit